MEHIMPLDGPWSFAYAMQLPDEPITALTDLPRASLPVYPCTVPGNFELDLHAQGIIPEPYFGMNMLAVQPYEHTHVWYGRRFSADDRPGITAELNFEGLDCYADIYLNGECIGQADNMLVPQAFNVTGRLRGDNELLVHIRPALDEAAKYPYPAGTAAMAINYESLYVRKAPHMYGWDIMPRAVSAGIWRPVTLQFRPEERIEEIYLQTARLTPDHQYAELRCHYRVTRHEVGDAAYELLLEGACGDSTFTMRTPVRFMAGQSNITVQQPALWWPNGSGAANLYRVTASLLKNGEVIDRRTFNHGIRTVKLVRTSITTPEQPGEFGFYVNGERVFIKGTNWVPLDAFHSRDIGRLPAAMQLVAEAHCNMIRCWGGNVYESDAFFDLCDEKGILVWQDFAMACAIYPQDEGFRRQIAEEARAVAQRLRVHACLALWAGDNECDSCYSWFGKGDPNRNVLTREVLPAVLRAEDPARDFLPSSPYIDAAAYQAGAIYLPEDHLWGPRDYFKSAFYLNSLAHFASEIGYHGCPAPESLREFLSPEKVWPYRDNDEWRLHCTDPVPECSSYSYRVELMANQVRVLFGDVPDTLEEFAFASQASQLEAKKFFIERFRTAKWRRTGLIWWNMLDGWPQFSDAVVDYYFRKKLAYEAIRRVQQPLCVSLCEPEDDRQLALACNDTREALDLTYAVTDLDTGAVLCQGSALAAANSNTPLAEIPFEAGAQRCYRITWDSPLGAGINHYLAGTPPFNLAHYRTWIENVGLVPVKAR